MYLAKIHSKHTCRNSGCRNSGCRSCGMYPLIVWNCKLDSNHRFQISYFTSWGSRCSTASGIPFVSVLCGVLGYDVCVMAHGPGHWTTHWLALQILVTWPHFHRLDPSSFWRHSGWEKSLRWTAQLPDQTKVQIRSDLRHVTLAERNRSHSNRSLFAQRRRCRCCNGDVPSQWRRVIVGPLGLQNPWCNGK